MQPDDIDDIDDTIRLPEPPAPAPKPPFPIMAAVVPVLGAVVMWALTRSPYALWFAFLGPLLAGASLLDGRRAARRRRRRAAAEQEAGVDGASRQIARRHARARAQAWRRTPGVAGYLRRPDDIWRSVSGRGDVIVVGAGDAVGSLQVTGGTPDVAAQVTASARRLRDMPVTVPRDAGIAVIGPDTVADAVARALVLQVCLAHAPGSVRLLTTEEAVARRESPHGAAGAHGLGSLPHATAASGVTVQLVPPGRPPGTGVDIPIVRVREGDPVPPRCRAVLTVSGAPSAATEGVGSDEGVGPDEGVRPDEGVMPRVRAAAGPVAGAGSDVQAGADAPPGTATTAGADARAAAEPDAAVGTASFEYDGRTAAVVVEGVTARQLQAVAEHLARRAESALGGRADPPLSLAGLAQPEAGESSLSVAVGTSQGAPVNVDLVEDGPHAVVIGTTGSGKSELLTTWITALSRRLSPQAVAFLLVDFKGGRSFDHLTVLPHVTGVVTDLDESVAARAIESLRAEIRHRERVLAEVGARDVADAGGAVGRLVIVVDEYAALVAALPTLHDLFADIAARGRALGMHLILASQRAAGVFRDAVLANAPLRISLRVTDVSDARAVMGDAEAVALPGSAAGRGIALVRRSADPAAVRVRVATADASLLGDAIGGPAARRPWLPDLPTKLPLDGLCDSNDPPAVVLGLADEPQRQAQPRVVLDADGLLAVGRAGSGRSAVIDTVAAQCRAAITLPPDPESAWDALVALSQAPTESTVLIDDVDLLLSRFPDDYRAGALELIERCAREARGRGIRLVVTAQRLSGGLSRLADLFPRRALLPLPTRTEHVAAGGEAAGHLPDAPPGRARIAGTLVQFAWTSPRPREPPHPVPVWSPGAGATALVVAPGERGVRLAAALSAVPVADADQVRAGSVVWGTAESWLARWPHLTAARGTADVVVDTAAVAEYRAVTGRRELPPYAVPGMNRAWVVRADEPVRRVLLPVPPR